MRRITWSLAFGAVLLPVVGGAQRAGARLTPVSQRITDEAFARDLSVFRSYQQRAARASVNASGGRRYLAERATQWIALAQEAYERNDRGAFPEDMLVLAERDLAILESGQTPPSEVMSSAVLFPNDVRLFADDAWGRAISLRRDADRVGAPDEIARAEAMLIRAGNSILSGPACSSDADAVRQVNEMLSAVERTRVNPVPAPAPEPTPPPQVVTERPAPVPQPDSARLPRRLPGACEAPERLTGVARAVHFALDKHNLAPATRSVLDRTIAQLKAAPGVRVRLSGHTDPRASNDYNQALSQRRVDAVQAYLTAAGIGAERILRAAAEGEERLVSSESDVRNMARNRRVEIVYLLCDGSELVPDETLDDLQLERRRVIEKEK